MYYEIRQHSDGEAENCPVRAVFQVYQLSESFLLYEVQGERSHKVRTHSKTNHDYEKVSGKGKGTNYTIKREG
jgi:hypothetical protein